ncbi:aromatic acid exporter family protein [Geomicrobium sp. JSM 1781026]|uniref:FUSC family protein n=1 Tax=Geomicrobium sp. JSM 1781026 TaxID=3344580 RepID=UPI0035C16129
MKGRALMQLFIQRLSNRTIKSLISIAACVVLCRALHLPPGFAVITTCLALEATSLDAVRNGAVRLGSALVGVSFALFFYYSLGAHPFWYLFAISVLLLGTMQLQVNKRTLIASISLFAMMPTMFDQHIDDYSVRVMSSMIGIMISTVVNIFVLPNNFMPELKKRHDRLFQELKALPSLYVNGKHPYAREKNRTRLLKSVQEFERMATLQRKQWQLRPPEKSEMRKLLYFSHQQRQVRTLVLDLSQRAGAKTAPYLIQFAANVPKHLHKLSKDERGQVIQWLLRKESTIPPAYLNDYHLIMRTLFLLERTAVFSKQSAERRQAG